MAIIRNKATSIKCYRDESAMQAEATGDLTLVYVVVGGIYIDPTSYNSLYDIEVFQDDNSVLHGLYRRK